MSYHPDFFNGGTSHRMECGKRLYLIREHISGGTLLDVGCSEGYCSFGMMDRCQVEAIDSVEENIHKCILTQKKHGGTVIFRHADVLKFLAVDERRWDSVLYLSAHHHLIAKYGMEKANESLARLARRTSVMLFDMGQKDEGCQDYQWWRSLPALGDNTQEQWLHEYLERVTGCREIVKIGELPIHGTNRMLWMLKL